MRCIFGGNGHPDRAVGRGGGIEGVPPPQGWQISHIREIGRSIGRLFGNKKCVYTSDE